MQTYNSIWKKIMTSLKEYIHLNLVARLNYFSNQIHTLAHQTNYLHLES